ncbi:MAG: hypothetical protein K2L12_06320 [Clostridia bacterium]|nr:hypothetical protein [Clostridia bacterium]
MQKIFKRVAILLAVMVSVVCLGVCLSACDGENDNTSGYSITVVYPDGKAVDGTKDGYFDLDENDKTVEVQICVVLANGETGRCFSTKKLDANGKATLDAPDYKLQKDEKFKIQINHIPQGYTYEYAYFTAPGSQTITLKNA